MLITKLRSANTVETQQYRKASKALLVLIPLLGITYLVILTGPEDIINNFVYAVLRALLISTQVRYGRVFVQYWLFPSRSTLIYHYFEIRKRIHIISILNLGIFSIPSILLFKLRSETSHTPSTVKLARTTKYCMRQSFGASKTAVWHFEGVFRSIEDWKHTVIYFTELNLKREEKYCLLLKIGFFYNFLFFFYNSLTSSHP